MNTSEQDRANAIEWAKAHLGMPGYDEAARHIMNVTGLGATMETQVWDPKKHAFTGADTVGGEVVMLDLDPYTRIIVMGTEDHAVESVDPSTLTPNGRRYEITEINTDADVVPIDRDTPTPPAAWVGDEPIDRLHMDDLTGWTTLAPYGELKNAPEGTVVAIEGKLPWALDALQRWWCGPASKAHDVLLEDLSEADAKGERVTILRWGNGARGKGPAL